jgi:pre-mRNA cleavage complex 2 protein Pcf11
VQDKVKINSLSMVAEDHADSRHNAAAIYNVIRKRLIEANVDYKLPLVYVIDSILKNVKGNYIKVIEQDVKTWMPIVHQALSEDNGVKLKKVWNLWKDGCIFEESKWREMGSCFSAGAALVSQDSSTGGPGTNATLEQAGITHGVRETLIFTIKSAS